MVNVKEALERISSSQSKTRVDGLADLRHILEHNRSSPKLGSISDKSFHLIYETLFDAVGRERSAYIKSANQARTKASSTSRLVEYASVIRCAVEVSIRKVKLKTVEALLGHIVQTLPLVGEGLCKPLRTDYIKALRSALEHQPHVEHITKEEWNGVAVFCVEGIKLLEDQTGPVNGHVSNGDLGNSTPDASRISRSGSHSRVKNGQVPAHAEHRQDIEELVLCLCMLTRVTNAPILDQAQIILTTMFSFVRSISITRLANQDAFKTINQVLARISLELTEVVENAVRGLVPLVKRCWSAKEPALRDEMLLTLIIISPKAVAMIMRGSEDSFRHEVDLLLDALTGSYSRKLEREQLQVDDISFRCRDQAMAECWPLGTRAFQLRTGRPRSESQWTWPFLIAQYASALDASRASISLAHRDRAEIGTSKKLRILDTLEDFIAKTSSSHLATKICALQIICFYVQQRSLSEDTVRSLVEKLLQQASEEHSSVSSWALTGLASCAFQPQARSPSLSSCWMAIWHHASRHAPSLSLCSPACHVLDVLIKLKLVNYLAISNVADSMITSFDLNGPAVLTESSSALWLTLLENKLAEHPSGFNAAAERVLHWTMGKWNPSNFVDRLHSFQTSQDCIPNDVLRIFYACVDRPFRESTGMCAVVLGPLAQTTLLLGKTQDLMGYLLLADVTDDMSSANAYQSQSSVSAGVSPVGHGHSTMENLLLDFCIAEVNKAGQRLNDWVSQRPQQVSTEMIRILTTLCLVASTVGYDRAIADLARKDALVQKVNSLAKDLAGFLSRSDCEPDKVDALLEITARSLPDITHRDQLTRNFFSQSGLIPLSLYLADALNDRSQEHDVRTAEDEFDLMDLGDDIETQQSRNQVNHQSAEPARSALAAQSDMKSLRQTVTAFTHLATASYQCEAIEASDSDLPSAFVQYLISMSSDDLLACRQLVSRLLSLSLKLSHQDCESLLGHLGSAFLRPYEYERCEVALGMCVEALGGLAHMWTDPESAALHEMGSDIYQWILNWALRLGFLSPHVLVAVADLFRTLLQIRPGYAQDASLPSVRTSLFKLLQEGDILVKWRIAQRLSDLFGLFVLRKHDNIFEDVHDSLPNTRDWKEGIAMRLFILSKLGSSWTTLLRRCVYHIFETAGEIPDSLGHAARCIGNIANGLRSESPGSIFRLFSPQLLHTWLEFRPLDKVPFAVFNYASLVELLKDAEEEVIGQLIMRSMDAEVNSLASLFNDRADHLIQKAFAKCAAYAIAWDTCTVLAAGKASSGSEAYLRNRLGRDQYAALVRQHFPHIIGLFFVSVDQDDQIERAFQKRPTYESAARALRSMKSISSSPDTLPLGQQPCFSAKYLLDQIERLCRRVSQHAESMWTPALFSYVLRMLLRSTNSSFGSLHACSVIRKIRILVAIAGNVTTEGYCLEAVLHALRPFFIDHQCADDAFGLAQFLIEGGKPYLETKLSFVAGFAISTFLSLRVLLDSTSVAILNDSQHKATLTKAHEFRSWLKDFVLSLDRSESPAVSSIQPADPKLKRVGDDLAPFLSLVRPACEVRAAGSSKSGAPESELLLRLLEDERNGRGILNPAARRLAVGLIARDFTDPPSFRDDVVGIDRTARMYAEPAFAFCRGVNVSDQYLLWVSRVLGRAYSSSGAVQLKMGRSPLNTDFNPKSTKSTTSRTNILVALSNLLLSEDQHHVSLGEEALSFILARLSNAEEIAAFEQAVRPEVAAALPLEVPVSQELRKLSSRSLEACFSLRGSDEVSPWIKDLSTAIACVASEDAILGALSYILPSASDLAEVLFPQILHLVLAREYDGTRTIRQLMSATCRDCFRRCDDNLVPYARVLLKAILYLRTQPVPDESTIADRNSWLELDPLEIADAAERCSMYSMALLYVESHSYSAAKVSRRSSVGTWPDLPVDLLVKIFTSLDEPDSFYGVQKQPDLISVLDHFDYEEHGFKSLLFRGAKLDSQMRRTGEISSEDAQGVLRSLAMLNLSSLTHALSSNTSFRDLGGDAMDNVIQTARKLEQWEIKAPERHNTEVVTIFRALQGLNGSKDTRAVRQVIDHGLLHTMKLLKNPDSSSRLGRKHVRTLGILSEIDDLMSSRNADELHLCWSNMQKRQTWMFGGKFEDAQAILSSRETLLGSLSRNADLRGLLHATSKDCRLIESEAVLAHSAISRRHGSLQHALVSTTYLSDLVPECSKVGLNIDGAARGEVAAVLWDEGEVATSIRMLQDLVGSTGLERQSIPVGRSKLLAQLGHHVAEARLEKPEDIITKYLLRAIKELKGTTQGEQAGEVFHEFAAFCDRQLQNSDGLQDFARMQKLRERKEAEVRELSTMLKGARSSDEKKTLRVNYDRARLWLTLDNQEYERLRHIREAFLQQSLENYMLSLQADETHDFDVLRFFALWIENADMPHANAAVGKHIKNVPSRKFASLMNQLSSRLQSSTTEFDALLAGLVFRLCKEHPYHGMFHIYAGARTTGGKDETAKSRNAAAKEISNALRTDAAARRYWPYIHDVNNWYHDLANFKSVPFKPGRDYQLEDFPPSKKVFQRVASAKVPPATMPIELRPDCDYRDVPKIVGWKPKMTIASGVSMPKVLTAIASDGLPYKQLFKGGSDDLRQDTIMEQVFDQVTAFLGKHKATRERHLHVRTYKIVPLSAGTGIIEFVRNTIPLNNFLMPAHEKYYPHDWKPSYCREKITQAASLTAEARLKTYKGVIDNFHPIGRYFFLERFFEPDEWFERRLAYTRSTAAISMLGYILGLGDRHCHNILLDEKSGEVIHIDLGVAFEAGRVLPIPELVPFRLTRDIVDAMGITRTEGVFRRCCEFVMEALREERDNIMTLLNVLRYDPLYSWTVSPLKAKRMQEAQEGTDGQDGVDVAIEGSKRNQEDSGEAGRALAVVEKKLSKTLSTAATVNELIQQATDDRNLALLYSGWAAYA